MDELNKLQTKDFPSLIEFIYKSSKNQKLKDIDHKITVCNTHILGIKDLKNTLESKEEAKKKQILLIMSHSTFSFNNT
jgi:hypothetical protein